MSFGSRSLARAGLLSLALLTSCKKDKPAAASVQVVAVERRDIVIDAQATGVVEPINVVEVKSKASGQITRMPVETGTQVRPGDLLVQLDTRDVQNQYDQVLAEVRAAQARLAVSTAQRRRSIDLAAQRIITAQENEAAELDYANAQAQLVRGRTNLDLAKQRLEDATVRAPTAGTVIEKAVSLGQVIASATGSFGGGTTLLKMADLNQVRVRALVNETDIGNVRPRQEATVIVDAYPERQFRGVVEKIEPQAVVQQSVTMFPVLVSLANRDGLLKPGMNGEVSMLVDRRANVLAVPNDAIRNVREAAAAAQILGLDPETVSADVRAQFASFGGGGGRGGAGASGGGGGAAGAAPARGTRRIVETSPGEVDFRGDLGGGAAQQAQAVQQPAAGQCEAVRAALARQPAQRQRLEGLRNRMMAGEIDRETARTEMASVYSALGVDGRVARMCMMQQRRQAQDGETSTGGIQQGAGGAAGQSNAPAATQQGQGARGEGAVTGDGARRIVQRGELGADGGASGVPRTRIRPGLLFVKSGGRYQPRVVRLGASNFDFTEVVSGAVEGDSVAMLAAATLQLQRQQQTDRFRSVTGGGVPGMQRQQPGAAAGAGAAPAGGGGGGRRGGFPQ